jgi:hypothetical protein
MVTQRPDGPAVLNASPDAAVVAGVGAWPAGTRVVLTSETRKPRLRARLPHGSRYRAVVRGQVQRHAPRAWSRAADSA